MNEKSGPRRFRGANRYVIAGLATALPALAGFVLVLVGQLLSPLLSLAARPLHALTGRERRRAGRALGRPIPEPEPGASPGAAPWRLPGRPQAWREVSWLLVHGLTGLVMGAVTLALWFALLATLSVPLWWRQAPGAGVRIFVIVRSWPEAVLLPLAQAALIAAVLYWVVPAGALFQRWLAASLLGPSPRSGLTRRIEQLTETRADALAAHGAELRRIERDLHDGAQARLVGLGLSLATAQKLMDTDPVRARALMRDAQAGAVASLTELRELIRGIAPPVLSERGLAEAVRALALDSPLEVTVDADLPPSLDPPIEAAVYFGIAELLTNAAKHARASRARISLARTGTGLVVEVRDDGRGGAEVRPDGGLAGLRRRLSVFDGTMEITSPPGGPTLAVMMVPCESL